MDDYGNELPATTLQQVNKRFNQGSERMAAIERDLKVATQELHERNQQMAELLEFFTAMKGAFKVLNWVGKVAKPLAAIVMLGGACVGFWTAIKGGASR
ncbi:MAG: hypothetical protein RR715_12375 [Comamonas sp.]|uniref:Uncharacterized protein n=1 Tax=Comamonas suwonensis TaxID=2606214 RepID=A0A843B7I0_9BURK|nr:hypothetical protein [Comamonas suwonensis]MBI1626763.1 hypothetical protein [Comamonas suwonensis]